MFKNENTAQYMERSALEMAQVGPSGISTNLELNFRTPVTMEMLIKTETRTFVRSLNLAPKDGRWLDSTQQMVTYFSSAKFNNWDIGESRRILQAKIVKIH